MASAYFETEKAICDSFREAANGTPFDLPNFELKEKPLQGDWLQLHILKGATEQATLGSGGDDETRGVIQLDINIPKGRGNGIALKQLDKFKNAFPIGKKISYNENRNITIIRISVSAGRYVGNYYRISLSFTYRYRTLR